MIHPDKNTNRMNHMKLDAFIQHASVSVPSVDVATLHYTVMASSRRQIRLVARPRCSKDGLLANALCEPLFPGSIKRAG